MSLADVESTVLGIVCVSVIVEPPNPDTGVTGLITIELKSLEH